MKKVKIVYPQLGIIDEVEEKDLEELEEAEENSVENKKKEINYGTYQKELRNKSNADTSS
jgi:hypothetical protein